MASGKNNEIRGIAVCNPVDVEADYLDYTVDYAIKRGFNHIQVIGPIHDPVKGNVDGMTEYTKYSQFNVSRNMEFLKKTMKAVNDACEKASKHGIKMFAWHHELDLPDGFGEAYPETLNEYGDYEITHPQIRDFLEWKLRDFFTQYPHMDGLILTLHETKVPLLKLKSQKLGRTERVKYVTEILYKTCLDLGKTLVVRPFASIEEDYEMMMAAYEEISPDLIVMDKWTQFDWSLCLPHNAFFHKIRKNPLLVESDIFGEYFGKGRLPIMLKEHIEDKVAYCNTFNITGHAARIDRNGMIPFGDVNEVNLVLMHAAVAGEDTTAAAEAFFEEKYPSAGKEVMALMEPTEDILRSILYLKGYYFSELSYFPAINHSKNHFYFEMMKENPQIVSGEWFIPKNWERGTIESVFAEKAAAKEKAAELLKKTEALQDKLEAEAYDALLVKFRNLDLVARIWEQLAHVYFYYAKWFETREAEKETALYETLAMLMKLRQEGLDLLGERFYCVQGNLNCLVGHQSAKCDFITKFVHEVEDSFAAEKEAVLATEEEGDILDYIICGGGAEGHALKKEVNFSDTLLIDGKLCRIPGNRQGADWSRINAHGWFSYEVKVWPKAKTEISLDVGSLTDTLTLKITVGDEVHEVRDEKLNGIRTLKIPYEEKDGKDTVRVRVDRLTGHTPCVYRIISR